MNRANGMQHAAGSRLPPVADGWRLIAGGFGGAYA